MWAYDHGHYRFISNVVPVYLRRAVLLGSLCEQTEVSCLIGERYDGPPSTVSLSNELVA
jgi:hypothetical protein